MLLEKQSSPSIKPYHFITLIRMLAEISMQKSFLSFLSYFIASVWSSLQDDILPYHHLPEYAPTVATSYVFLKSIQPSPRPLRLYSSQHKTPHRLHISTPCRAFIRGGIDTLALDDTGKDVSLGWQQLRKTVSEACLFSATSFPARSYHAEVSKWWHMSEMRWVGVALTNDDYKQENFPGKDDRGSLPEPGSSPRDIRQVACLPRWSIGERFIIKFA